MKSLSFYILISLIPLSSFAARLSAQLETQHLKDVELRCGKQAATNSGQYSQLPFQADIEAVIESCLAKGQLSSRKVIPSLPWKEALKDIIEIGSGQSVSGKAISAPNIYGLDLEIEDGDFSLYGRVKYLFWFNIYSWGDVEYFKDAQSIKVKVDKIKLGYVPITRAVFAALARLNIKNMRVEPPYIWIDLPFNGSE